MNFIKLQQSMFITLFFMISLPIFSADIQKPEVFESCLSQCRAQTQNIGFCIQQILQTIDAGKITLSTQEKKEIVFCLIQLQKMIDTMMSEIYSQNTPEALLQATCFNQKLINFLHESLSTDIKKIHHASFNFIKDTTKSTKSITGSKIVVSIQNNNQKLQELIQITDHLGLSKINQLYRKLQEYNAYGKLKYCANCAGLAVFAGYVLCAADCEYLNKNFSIFKSVIGRRPKWIQSIDEYCITEDDNLTPLNSKNQTPFQALWVTSQHLQKDHLITVGCLLSMSLEKIGSYLISPSYNWIKEQSESFYKNFDSLLSGRKKQKGFIESEEKVYFKDMIGCKELEILADKIANFMMHPERYERSQIEEHRGILLYGPPQTGKSLFAKALRTLIADKLGSQKKISFINAKHLIDNNIEIDMIFRIASYHAPCILFFDEIDMLGTHRDKNPVNTSQLLTCMQGLDASSKQVIVIAATNRPEKLDPALLVDGRFGKIIHLDYPKYTNRKLFLQQQLSKRCVQISETFIDHIAQETEGCSYNNLMRIITEALILSSVEMRPVSSQDFEKVLDSEIRKIQPPIEISEDEKRIIATYQAGKAIARHALQTSQQIVKITINPVIKNVKSTDAVFTFNYSSDVVSENEKLAEKKPTTRTKLGDVFTKTTSSYSDLISNSQQEKECMTLLAGNIATELMLGESFSQCNKHDRAEALQIIYSMIGSGEKVDDQIKAKALKIKEQYEEKIRTILEKNKSAINSIVALLLAQNTINREEWETLSVQVKL